MGRFKARFSEVDAIKVKIVEPGDQEGTAGYLVAGRFVGESTFESFYEVTVCAIAEPAKLNGSTQALYKAPTRKHKRKKKKPARKKPLAAPAISAADRLKRVEDLVLEVLGKGECDSGVIIEYVQARRETTARQTIHTQLQRMKNEGVIDVHKATGTNPRLWFKTD